MPHCLVMNLSFITATVSAQGAMANFIAPVLSTMCIIASLVCVFFLLNGGIGYMTSSGKPEKLDHAKRTVKNALIGLVLVLGASATTAVLIHSYHDTNALSHSKLPNIAIVQPSPMSNGLVDILSKTVTGFLEVIVQSLTEPFLKSLAFFTHSTPLMVSNSAVFNLWLAVVGISDSLFVIVVALLGFHIMSASSFGLNEIEIKHLLPRLALIFLLLNSSIFVIDGVIEVSNLMIRAIGLTSSSTPVWSVLSSTSTQASTQGLATLIMMIAFLVLAALLLVYYISRIVTLYVGAVLSPIILLLWLLPGYKEFSETAGKTYFSTIFVLFVQVVILQLAASLFSGISAPGANSSDILMATITGLATLATLLKAQGVMTRLSYVSTSSHNVRMLGGQFINGASYILSRNSTVEHRNATADTGLSIRKTINLKNQNFSDNLDSAQKEGTRPVSLRPTPVHKKAAPLRKAKI